MRRGARILGLVLIAIPVVSYKPLTAFPGVSALLPCLGSALFLWAGLGSASIARSVLSPSRAARFFGKISYSFYLWHWRLFVYLKFYKMQLPIGRFEKAALFAVTVGLAYVSHRFIEQPFRRKVLLQTRRSLFCVASGVTTALLLVSVLGVFKMPDTAIDRDRRLHIDTSFPEWYRWGVCLVEHWEQFSDKNCLTLVPGKTNVLVWGDSTAAEYMRAFDDGFDAGRIHLLQATGAACPASLIVVSSQKPFCSSFEQRMVKFLEDNTPDLVILSGVWTVYANDQNFGEIVAATKQLISVLKGKGIPVLLIGPPISFVESLPPALIRAKASNTEVRSSDILRRNSFVRDELMRQEFPSRDGVAYVSVLEATCPDRQCPVLAPNGTPLASDSLHLTTEGSALVGQAIVAAAKKFLPDKLQ